MEPKRPIHVRWLSALSSPTLWRTAVAVIGLAHGGCGAATRPEPVRPVIRRDPEAEELLKIAGLDAACFRVEGGSFEVWPDGGRSFDWCRSMSRNHLSLSLMTSGENVAPSDMKKEGTVILLREVDGGWKFALNEKRTWKAAPAAPTPKRPEQAEANDLGDVLAGARTTTSGTSSATGGYGFSTEPAEGELPGKDGQRLVVNLEQATALDEEGVIIATIEMIGEGTKVVNSLPIRCALAKPPTSSATTEQPAAKDR